MIFYVDVYFLINFTVDMLALYFAASLSKVKGSVVRLCLISGLGAFLSVAGVLFGGYFATEVLLGGIYFASSLTFAARGTGFYRRMKTSVLLFVFQILIGGIVTFGYGLLDKYLYMFIYDRVSDEPNRRLLILSVLILLSIGVFKLLLALFSHTQSERQVEVQITLFEGCIEACGLVDTGNLLKEPSGLLPVILLKKSVASKLSADIPYSVEDVKNLQGRIAKRICLIPVHNIGGGKILVGIRPDTVNISLKNGKRKKNTINAVIAIDTEGGTYGGYEILVPSAALDDVR